MPSNAVELSALLTAEKGALLRVIERVVGDRSDAEDVAQFLWFKVQRIADDPPILHKRAFLLRLARNLAIDWTRAERRRERLNAEARDILAGDQDQPGPDRIVHSLVVLRRVRVAAAAMPEPTRTIFRLNRFEGLSQVAIAQRQGISTTKVENHIRRALAILAAARDGGDTPADRK